MIEIIHAYKKIKGCVVLDDVNLKIESGTVTGLSGINGSGKTMLMRLICGLIHPDTGEVRICGKVLQRDIDFPGSIGVLLENPAFLRDYTGTENLKLLALIKGFADDGKINSALERVGLTDVSDLKYKKYSLGMKQRLGIAAAVMESPDIILLDEPMNSLDDDGVRMALDVIKHEKERGAAVIWSCHDPFLLKENSDIVFEIKAGHVMGRIK